MSRPPSAIDCIECGGTANLVSFLPDDEPLEPEYPVAYSCADCLQRLDMVWTDED